VLIDNEPVPPESVAESKGGEDQLKSATDTRLPEPAPEGTEHEQLAWVVEVVCMGNSSVIASSVDISPRFVPKHHLVRRYGEPDNLLKTCANGLSVRRLTLSFVFLSTNNHRHLHWLGNRMPQDLVKERCYFMNCSCLGCLGFAVGAFHRIDRKRQSNPSVFAPLFLMQ
jgi:hypothetical protein